jgi:hypothetical protein
MIIRLTRREPGRNGLVVGARKHLSFMTKTSSKGDASISFKVANT